MQDFIMQRDVYVKYKFQRCIYCWSIFYKQNLVHLVAILILINLQKMQFLIFFFGFHSWLITINWFSWAIFFLDSTPLLHLKHSWALASWKIPNVIIHILWGQIQIPTFLFIYEFLNCKNVPQNYIHTSYTWVCL